MEFEVIYDGRILCDCYMFLMFLVIIVVIIGNSCLLLFLIIVSVFISSLIHHIFVMIYPKYNWCIYRPYTYDILCVRWLQIVVLGYFFYNISSQYTYIMYFLSVLLLFCRFRPENAITELPWVHFQFHGIQTLNDKTCWQNL